MSWLADERVIHDERQVRSLDGLEVGKLYRNFCVNSDGQVEERGILEIILIDRQEGKIRVKLRDSKVEELYIENFGIVPYWNKKWNAVNYLVPVS